MKDLISRQQAINEMYCLNPTEDYVFIDAAIDVLENLPSVQQERKTGKWEDNYPIIVEHESLRCNVCHSLSPVGNYCYHCGAKMEGEQDERY